LDRIVDRYHLSGELPTDFAEENAILRQELEQIALEEEVVTMQRAPGELVPVSRPVRMTSTPRRLAPARPQVLLPIGYGPQSPPPPPYEEATDRTSAGGSTSDSETEDNQSIGSERDREDLITGLAAAGDETPPRLEDSVPGLMWDYGDQMRSFSDQRLIRNIRSAVSEAVRRELRAVESGDRFEELDASLAQSGLQQQLALPSPMVPEPVAPAAGRTGRARTGIAGTIGRVVEAVRRRTSRSRSNPREDDLMPIDRPPVQRPVPTFVPPVVPVSEPLVAVPARQLVPVTAPTNYVVSTEEGPLNVPLEPQVLIAPQSLSTQPNPPRPLVYYVPQQYMGAAGGGGGGPLTTMMITIGGIDVLLAVHGAIPVPQEEGGVAPQDPQEEVRLVVPLAVRLVTLQGVLTVVLLVGPQGDTLLHLEEEGVVVLIIRQTVIPMRVQKFIPKMSLVCLESFMT